MTQVLEGYRQTSYFLNKHGFVISVFGLQKIALREPTFPPAIGEKKAGNGKPMKLYDANEMLLWASKRMKKGGSTRGLKRIKTDEEMQQTKNQPETPYVFDLKMAFKWLRRPLLVLEE